MLMGYMKQKRRFSIRRWEVAKATVIRIAFEHVPFYREMMVDMASSEAEKVIVRQSDLRSQLFRFFPFTKPMDEQWSMEHNEYLDLTLPGSTASDRAIRQQKDLCRDP